MELMKAVLPHAIGYAALALIVAGVWGAFGWPVALIVLGAPDFAAYVWHQWRTAQMPRPRGDT